MKHILTTLICLMLLITACENKKVSFSLEDYLHVIDLNKTEFVDIKLSELFASVTPIVLETTKESLIGNISKAVITPEYIIVFDASVAKALFLFRKDGTFLHKFGRVGNGPGEYSHIASFCYDNATGTIYMLDFHTNNVNLYDIHTGEFLKSIKLKNDNGFSQSIYYHAGELYTGLSNFTNNNEKKLLNRRNQATGSIEKSWFDLEIYSKNIDYIGTNPFLFGDGNSFKFHTFFMDGIMSVEKGKITPFLTFTPEYTLENNDLNSLNLDNIALEFYTKLPKTNKVFNINTYFEHKNLLFLQFNLSSVFPQTLIYNQKTKDFRVGKTLDDILFEETAPYYFPQFVAYDDNGLYARFGYNEMNILKNNLEKDFVSEGFKKTAIKLANLEKDANPVLLYYEFKD